MVLNSSFVIRVSSFRSMSDFVKVASIADLPDPGRQLVEVEDRIVALFHVGGQFYCIDDVCTHDGGPLSEGTLAEFAIACPRHGAKFDIRTGKALTMPATEDTVAHEVKVENGQVLVRINDGTGPASKAPALAPSLTASTIPTIPTAKTESCTVPPIAAPIGEVATANASDGPRELSEDLVREELKKVIDPELFVNIVDLGLIYNVDLLPAEGKTNIKIDMTMTSPMCPAGPQLIANSKQVVGALPGVAAVEVKIVLDPPWTPDKMTDEARDQLGIF
jgi:metal-sulfur cluster biosynthetic enzyme/nitrite reductase/ring-hydroxylating ferredoxin subunit